MQFLIAEDDSVWLRLEQSIVTEAGHHHSIAGSWPKVISLLRQQKFDGMIVDLSLVSSSESGIEALQFINSLDPPDTLVICTYLSNKLLQECYALPFVKSVFQKSRIADHVDEIAKFVGGQLDSIRLRRLLTSDLSGERLASHSDSVSTKETRETVFVVHGRDHAARREMFTLLRAMGLKPLEWGSAIKLTGSASPYVGDVLEVAFNKAAAVIVLLTGDDEARLLKKYLTDSDPDYEVALTCQPRPNVLFEAGLAFGRKPERTLLVQFSNIRPFSDVGGRHILHFRGSANDRNELATRLETAGCAVRRDGADWLTAGNFDLVCGKLGSAVTRDPS